MAEDLHKTLPDHIVVSMLLASPYDINSCKPSPSTVSKLRRFVEQGGRAELSHPTLRYLTLPYVTLRYPTLRYPTYPSLPYPTLPYPTLPYPTISYLPYPSLPYATIPYHTLPTLPYPTLHYPTLPYPTYPTLPYPTLRYPTLPYPTYPTIPYHNLPYHTIPYHTLPYPPSTHPFLINRMSSVDVKQHTHSTATFRSPPQPRDYQGVGGREEELGGREGPLVAECFGSWLDGKEKILSGGWRKEE